MNILMQQIAAYIKQYPWQTKLLLVPSLRDGHQLLEGLSRQGIAWANLRPVTLRDMALEIIDNTLTLTGKQLASHDQLLGIVEQVIASHYAKGKLAYFAKLQEKGVLGRVLISSMLDLRLAGVNPDQTLPQHFVDPVKGAEIQQILTDYLQMLIDNDLVDEADVYQMAIDRLGNNPNLTADKLILIPEQIEFEPIPLNLINTLLAHGAQVLAEEPVYGLNVVRSNVAASTTVTGESALSYLFEPQSAPAQPDVSIFRAYGKSNEVAAILRRIKAGTIPLDQVLITASVETDYLTLLYTQAQQIGLPVTFSSGVPNTLTGPGKLALSLTQWIQGNYLFIDFYHILTSRVIKIANSTEMARSLRDENIGWGRNRYWSAVNRLIAANSEGQAKAQNQGNEGLAKKYEYTLQQLDDLQSLFADMEQYIPEPDQEGMVSFPQCCLGIAHLVQNYARIHSEAEAEAAAQIRSCLEQLAQNWPVSLSCEKAWQRIQEAIEALRVQRQSPQPGCLHLASMAYAEWINRPVVFVLGLHAGALDQVTLQDPVLLDSEREQISSLLPLRRNMQSRRNYLITRFLASCRGSITLSFPCFDTVEGRACLPSALLLQVYRLISRNPLADYTAFLEWLAPASAYYPDQPANALNESEWWLSQVKSTVDAVVAQDKLLSLYPLLADGWEARQARYSEYISAYDGRLDCDGLTLDPRHNPELIMSASALEKIAKCPFGYFLQYILRVKLPQDLQADNGIWLDALNRGSLLHLIYCRYLRMVYNHNHKPDQSLLIQIASEEISQMAEEIPPPSRIVYDLEKQELLHSLDVFWSLLEEQNQAGESRPAFFEVPFGMAADEIPDAAMGQADAVAIPLPSGAYLKLRGKIDRIDIDIKGNYQVWDFKTGGLYGYAERGYTAKGQQVQHVLYSQAAEIMLSEHTGKPVQVNQAGYIFPTQKGEGQRRVRQQSSRTKGLEAVEKILDLLQTAVFHATSDSKPCTYCDYRIVCRETRTSDKKTVASEKIKSLVKGANCADLDVWKELQQYV